MSPPDPPHGGSQPASSFPRHAREVMAAAMAVGEAMLRSRVATSEVESSVRRLLTAFGLGNCEVSVMLNQIELSLPDERLESPITLLKVTDTSEVRLDLLVAVESLIRSVEAGEAGPEDVSAELPAIVAAAPARPRWTNEAFYMVSVAAWVVFAGGGPVGAATGLVGAVIIRMLVVPAVRDRVPEAFEVVLAAAVTVAVPAAAAHVGVPVALTPAIVGGLFPLLPGGALVAAVTDWLYGAPLSATAKGLQTLLTGVSLALGAAAALAVVDSIGIVSAVDVPVTPRVVIVAAAAAAVTALALSRGMPLRLAPAGAVLSAAAWMVREALPVGPQVFPIDVFVAALVIGAGSQLLARVQRTTPSIHTTTTVFVLVPGLVMYLSMVAFTSGETETGVELLIDSLGVSAAIAAGVALGVALTRSVPLPRPRVRTWRNARNASTDGPSGGSV